MSRLLIEIVTRASARDFTVNHETLNKHSNESNKLQLILQEILNKHLTNKTHPHSLDSNISQKFTYPKIKKIEASA